MLRGIDPPPQSLTTDSSWCNRTWCLCHSQCCWFQPNPKLQPNREWREDI